MRTKIIVSGTASLILSVALVGAAHTSTAAETNSTVSVATDLHAALGIDAYMMTEKEEAGTPDPALTSTEEMFSKVTDAIGLDDSGVYPDGFAGLIKNPATGALNIWWQGDFPESIAAAVKAAGPTVDLERHAAPYERNELLRAIEASRSEMAGVDLAFPRTDGTGIVITHAPNARVDANAIAKRVGYPVTVAEDTSATDLAGGRQADVAPHNGGAMLIRANGEICSTGFAVLAGVEGRLLSAAHCDTTGNVPWTNGNGAQLTPGGSAVSVALSVDSMLINPNGGTSGYIYTGGYNSSSRTAVAGTDTNNIGDTVATGGANSGAHQGAVIINDAYPGNCLGYSCTLIVAEAAAGQTLGVEGDSGGPVYHTLSGGRVDAKGIILQGAQQIAQANCAPMKYSGNACFNRVRYQPIRPLLSVWGVSIETHS